LKFNLLPHPKHIGALKMDTGGYIGHAVSEGTHIFGSGRIPYTIWIYRGKGGRYAKESLDTFFQVGYQVRRDAQTDQESVSTKGQAMEEESH
jgi:hypothetical protein